jgi:AraC-like DNA-binding protein
MTVGASVVEDHDDLHFDSNDLAETEEFLGRTYAKMSIRSDDERTTTRVGRRWLGDISFDELEFDWQMAYNADPLGRICLCRVHSGHIEESFVGEPDDEFAPGEVNLVSPPELPFAGRVCNATYDLTMFDPALLDRVATARDSDDDSVRLLGHQPVSAQATRQLHSTIDYLRTVVQTDHLRASPLLATTAAEHLAAVVISTFPTNAELEPTAAERNSAKPELLRRAAAFIDAHAHTDIALSDIASAVHVTPRALQYTFRRHLDMSPIEYLRRVRLDHAHRQLRREDPSTTSVQTIAAQWGFAHAGRFSALYRQTYGRNPSDTLKN